MRKMSCFSILLTALLMLPFTAVQAEEYKYTVTISAGDQGELSDVIRLEVDPDAYVTIDLHASTEGYELLVDGIAYQLKVKDEKYAPVGLKEAGLDNKDNGNLSYLASSVLKINEDKRYVVYYGVSAALVDYTVIYQTDSGVELGRNVYKGKIGDKPVVAALAFDNYLPDAYNRTGTLKEGAANTFTFIYHPLSETITYITENEYEETEGETETRPSSSGTILSPNTVENNEQVPEIVEIIDEDVPLAAPETTGNQASVPEAVVTPADNGFRLNRYLLIGAILGSLAIFGIFLILLWRSKEEESE